MFSPGFRARKDRTSCLEHGGISSQPLGLREPPAAPTQPVSRQAPVWEPEATSSVTWITFTSHFHAFSGRFPLTPGGGGCPWKTVSIRLPYLMVTASLQKTRL